MKTIYMFVYNDIATDARVVRAAKALAKNNKVILYAIGTLPDKIDNLTSIAVKNCEAVGGIKANLKFIWGAFSTFFKVKPDVVFGHDIFSAVPFVLIRLFSHKLKFVYDAHELFLPENGRPSGIIEKIQYRLEGKAIQKADLVLCAQTQRGKLMQKYHRLAVPPTVIRNISYLPQVPDEELEKKYADFFSAEGFSVVYAGGFLKGRRLDELMRAVDAQNEPTKLMLIGSGPDADRLQKIQSELQNPNIMICPSVPYHKLWAILRHFDAGFLYYSTDCLNNLYCAPNKIFEYASIPLPIIANENPTVIRELDHYGIGVCNNDFLKFAGKKMLL